MSDIKLKIKKVIEESCRGLVGREDQMKSAVLALLAKEHALLIGPPGTAKSMLAKRMKKAVNASNYFERFFKFLIEDF